MSFGGGNIGDAKRVVATGAVKMLQKGVDGEDPVEASGAIFTYDIPTGMITIHGGFAWVKKGQNLQIAEEPNLGIRIDKNNQVYADKGKWRTEIILNQDNKDKDKGKDKDNKPKPGH